MLQQVRRLADIICAFIAAVAAVISAVVTAKNNSRHRQSEKRAELRSLENRLMMDMIHANNKLLFICSSPYSIPPFPSVGYTALYRR